MSLETSLNTPDKERPKARTLSIEIEPSSPLILAIAQLFRAHNRPTQSVDLCKMGLNYFPRDLGLRLGMAMAYQDLKEKDKAWNEIKSVAQELNNLAPTLGSIAERSRQLGDPRLSDWFTLISQVLAKYPKENQETKLAPQVTPELPPETLEIRINPPRPEKEPSLFTMEGNRPEEEKNPQEGQLESKVLSTLGDWLSQLKENRT